MVEGVEDAWEGATVAEATHTERHQNVVRVTTWQRISPATWVFFDPPACTNKVGSKM